MNALTGLLERFKKYSNSKADVLIHSRKEFQTILNREHNRSDRSGLCFSVAVFQFKVKSSSINPFISQLKKITRLTDELGWYDECSVGVCLSNTPAEGAWQFVDKVKLLSGQNCQADGYCVYTYPKRYNETDRSVKISSDKKENERQGRDLFLEMPLLVPVWKRTIDLVASSLGLIFFSPLFLLVAALIKTVSPGGPIFFKQTRIGFGGRKFIFLKFRTMKVGSDVTDHKELLTGFINNNVPMTKLDHKGKRILFGKILRLSCVDELPQLINVLRGEMSLVGPRPPIPYEVQEYKAWHRGRFMTVPGITGLWQVSGKNRLAFNEMVRLDIKYIREKSLPLDLKILFFTPLAILTQIMDTLFGHPLPSENRVSS